jgi:hypothetical protein
MEEAFNHLLGFHVLEVANTQPPPRSQMCHWIVSSSGADLEKQNDHMIRLLSTLLRRFEALRYKSVDIRNSVANENNEKPADYLLPVSLVKAAEKIFQTVYTSHYSVKSLHRHHTDAAASVIELEIHTDLIDHFGSAANDALSEARRALLLMAHTGDTQASVLDVHCTLESLMLSCFVALSDPALLNGLGALELYEKHLSSMVCVFN